MCWLGATAKLGCLAGMFVFSCALRLNSKSQHVPTLRHAQCAHLPWGCHLLPMASFGQECALPCVGDGCHESEMWPPMAGKILRFAAKGAPENSQQLDVFAVGNAIDVP